MPNWRTIYSISGISDVQKRIALGDCWLVGREDILDLDFVIRLIFKIFARQLRDVKTQHPNMQNSRDLCKKNATLVSCLHHLRVSD